MSRPSRWLVLGLAACVLSSCAAPAGRRNFGVRSYQTDILLGAKTAPTPAPPSNAGLGLPGFPAPLPFPPGITLQSPPPRPPDNACPTARPTDYPKAAVTQELGTLPLPGTYDFRQSGSRTENGATQALAPSMQRSIADVKTATDPSSAQVLTYTMKDLFVDHTAIETKYQTVTNSPEDASDGLYLVQQIERDARGALQATFTPATPVLIMRLPAQGLTSAQGWDSTGTDPLNGVAMQVHGIVTAIDRVDACGTVIEAWRVELTGQIVRGTSGADDAFTVTYDVATQLGGIFVGVDSTVTRTVAGTVTFKEHAVQVVNSDYPKEPAA